MRGQANRAGFLVIAVMLALAPAAHAADRNLEILNAIDRYRTALMNHDVAALRQIWADEYVFTNARGELFTKEERLRNIHSGATQFEKIATESDLAVRFFGDVAVATGSTGIEGQYAGRPTSGRFRMMQVWVERDGRWQLAANTLTPIVPPKPVGRRP